MDAHIKEGQLYVHHQKFGKKWKKNWFVLYPASQNGIARLEFYDSPSGGGGGAGVGAVGGSNEKTRKLDKKIIRLSECISILPASTEACPKDNMAAFYVETNDKTHVFAAEKSTALDWMEKMCDIAFQGGSGHNSAGGTSNGGQDLQMSENLIYYSREEVNEFRVSVQRTDASERCGLSGSYWLKADKEALVLWEPKARERHVLVWPYKLLRRYGRDKTMFSFEAGRRCDSGPGNFTFDTKQGNDIFHLVEQAIQTQKARVEEVHLSGGSEVEWPSTQLRNSAATGGGGFHAADGSSSGSSSSREADGDSGGSKPGSADGVLGRREGGDGGGVGAPKARGLPDLPSIMAALGGGGGGGGGGDPRTPRHGGKGPLPGPPSLDAHAAVYSEPADSMVRPASGGDALYSDPVDTLVIPGQPAALPRLRPLGDESSGGGANFHGNGKTPEVSLYDQISVDLSLRAGALGLEGGGGRVMGASSKRGTPAGQADPPLAAGRPEHIYDEPEGCAKAGPAPPPNIYDEARLEPGARWRMEEVAAPAGQEGNYSQISSHTQRGSPPQLSVPGRSAGAPPPPNPRRPKPTTAPKPPRGGAHPRKEPVPLPVPLPGKPAGNVNNNNNNNGNAWPGQALYSKVFKDRHQGEPRAPGIIYDNLGDI